MLETLKTKYAGVPVWVWALMGVAGLALFLQRRKAKSATQKTATNAAAAQTSTDLTSASALANMFTTAGLMPYSGGNTYVNTSTPAPVQPEETVTVNVGKDQTVGELVKELRANGYPGFNWSDFWALNPNIVNDYGLTINSALHDWQFTHWWTPVTVYKPGTKMGLPISGDNPNPTPIPSA